MAIPKELLGVGALIKLSLEKCSQILQEKIYAMRETVELKHVLREGELDAHLHVLGVVSSDPRNNDTVFLQARNYCFYLKRCERARFTRDAWDFIVKTGERNSCKKGGAFPLHNNCLKFYTSGAKFSPVKFHP